MQVITEVTHCSALLATLTWQKREEEREAGGGEELSCSKHLGFVTQGSVVNCGKVTGLSKCCCFC